MLFFFIYLVLVTLSVLGYGLLTNFYFINKKIAKSFNFGETGLIGFFLYYLISVSFHFFIPLSQFFNSVIILLGITLFFIFRRLINLQISLILFLTVAILIFPGLITLKNHPDFDWYYLPYVNYLNNFKIIFGIANVNDFLGYVHSWNDISALFNIPIINAKGLTLIPILFYFFYIITLLEYYQYSKNIFLKIFIFFILVFCISNYTKTSEFGGDIPSISLSFLVCILFIKLLNIENIDNTEIIFKILLFWTFACILRINYIILSPIIIFLLIKDFKILIKLFFQKKIIYIFSYIAVIFLLKNIIVSGCFFYPIPQTCLTKNIIHWSIESEHAQMRFDLLSASAKGWQNHIVIDGQVDDRVDYVEPLKKNLIMNPGDYINNESFFWVKYWLKNGDIIKILNNILIVLFSFVIVFLFSNMRSINFTKKIFTKKYFYSFIVFLTQIVLWFNLSPQSRYGGDTAIVVFFSLIFAILFLSLKFDKNKLIYGLISVIFLSLLYFEYKNISRISNEYFFSSKSNINFPWSNITEFEIGNDYYQSSINGYNLNLKKSTKTQKTGTPTWCGNIDMLCLPEERFICIKNIDKKNGYLFVSGNHKQCIQHLKNRLWY